ncbi:hypothetical protein [Shouchella patagoniensis]|uniref:hypothetical protein n=1 Tax=Shouchella patagoniensis TaxID=228576 RepID=UPI00099503C3|nr:hypothetical protein [Shouchella patagoniensis]
MLRNLFIGGIVILFLSGFFFLNEEEANPYKEKTETIDETAFIEIQLNHKAAEFALEQGEEGWLDFHFEQSISEKDLLLFSKINTELEPTVAEENGSEVTLNWQGTEVYYKKNEKHWKIEHIKEVSIVNEK